MKKIIVQGKLNLLWIKLNSPHPAPLGTALLPSLALLDGYGQPLQFYGFIVLFLINNLYLYYIKKMLKQKIKLLKCPSQ